MRNVERDLSEVALATHVIRIFSDSLNGWAKHLKGHPLRLIYGQARRL